MTDKQMEVILNLVADKFSNCKNMEEVAKAVQEVRNMAKKEKTFNYKLYALVAFLLVAAILACTTVFAVKQKYIAFDSEKLAVSYADTIIQKGDGYNAYTYTLSAKGDKYGDFIRENYMYPIIYPGYSKDMDSKEFKELKKSGLDTDSHKSETTLNDDGTLSGVLAEHMYPYYIELIKTYGWDDYDAIYTNYFNKLVEERKAIFNDDYMLSLIHISEPTRRS